MKTNGKRPEDHLVDQVRNGQLPPCRERRRIRVRARIPRPRLGEALGVSVMTIYRWETDGNPRTLDMRIRYRELLDRLNEVVQ